MAPTAAAAAAVLLQAVAAAAAAAPLQPPPHPPPLLLLLLSLHAAASLPSGVAAAAAAAHLMAGATSGWHLHLQLIQVPPALGKQSSSDTNDDLLLSSGRPAAELHGMGASQVELTRLDVALAGAPYCRAA